jgi:replicative DNA helicase
LAKLGTLLPTLKEAPIFIDDESSLTVFEIRSRLRAMKQRFGIRLAIVDYLQLVVLPPEFRGDTVRGYGEVAKGLMASAKELNIPIILLSQLSREGEKRGGTPKMSDLRESGDIEACAHFIGILYREKLSAEEEEEQRDKLQRDPMSELTVKTLMEVCKNRNGPSGTAMQLDFHRWCMRFEDRHNPVREPQQPKPPASEPDRVIDEETAADLAAWSDRQGKARNNGGAKSP